MRRCVELCVVSQTTDGIEQLLSRSIDRKATANRILRMVGWCVFQENAEHAPIDDRRSPDRKNGVRFFLLLLYCCWSDMPFLWFGGRVVALETRQHHTTIRPQTSFRVCMTRPWAPCVGWVSGLG